MKPELREFYYKNGQIKEQIWLVNNLYNNENGPALIWYYENGQIEVKAWYLNSEVHNENGPAIIVYNQNGTINKQAWYLNGKQYTEEEFKKYKLIKEMSGIK